MKNSWKCDIKLTHKYYRLAFVPGLGPPGGGCVDAECKMTEIIEMDLKKNKNRGIVMQIIRHDLYPEEEFPEKLFPDLTTVLFNGFMEAIKDRDDYRAIYREPAADGKLENLAREILDFKNLLGNHPRTVVLMYRAYIRKFIRYKHPGTDEWEDIYQEVMTRLFSGKIHRIQERFDFTYTEGYNNFSKKTFFTSYLMVTIRNIYMDIIRERNVRPLTAGQLQPVEDSAENYEFRNEDMLKRVAIEEEFRKFRTLLALYYKGRPRIELFLKLKCRITLTQNDISTCFPGCSSEDIDLLSQNFRGIKDKQLFDTVLPVFNRNEGRENKSDTLRKWVSVKVDEITSHLNQTHRNIVYTSKNLVDFVTLYYERFGADGAGELSGVTAPVR